MPGRAWDHVGPFKVKTWSGKGVFSLKVDIFSGKLEPTMAASTGSCEQEWMNFVLRLRRTLADKLCRA